MKRAKIVGKIPVRDLRMRTRRPQVPLTTKLGPLLTRAMEDKGKCKKIY